VRLCVCVSRWLRKECKTHTKWSRLPRLAWICFATASICARGKPSITSSSPMKKPLTRPASVDTRIMWLAQHVLSLVYLGKLDVETESEN
jgi:hypothetical protein